MQSRFSGARNWLIVVGVLIAAGVAAYFVGTATVKGQLQSAQRRIASLQSVNQLLTANVSAYRAAIALDNRNFGVANDDVAKVVVSLNAIDATAAGLDNGSLTALKTEAAGVKIAVATNLEPQRAQLIQLSDHINAVSGQTPASIDPAHN